MAINESTRYGVGPVLTGPLYLTAVRPEGLEPPLSATSRLCLSPLGYGRARLFASGKAEPVPLGVLWSGTVRPGHSTPQITQYAYAWGDLNSQTPEPESGGFA